MKISIKNKILIFNELIEKVEELRKSGKIIVQTHGIFDLIHPGIITHLNSAKNQGDVLILTVIKDEHVRRGPGRPVFPEELRLENVASLEQVDYVSLVDDENPFECVKILKPDIFAKGKPYKDRDKQIHRKIFEEERELYFGKSKIYETNGFSFSSSKIINDFLDIYPPETKKFLNDFSKKYSFQEILERITSLKDLKILLIGDGIIDEFHYCEALGKSAKAHLVVSKYLNHEVFAGGVFAIANHIAEICDNVHLMSTIGNEGFREDFIVKNLNPKIKSKFFYREDGPTIVKKRYINEYLNQKLFEVDYLNNNYISEKLETDIIEYLTKDIPLYDMVLVSDFGHGFISKKIISTIQQITKKFAVNTQTNSANAGYNMITKYYKPTFVCLDENELRLSAQDRYGDIETITKKIAREINCDNIIVTRGRHGSIGINKDSGEMNRTPIFSTKVIDTVGAGDAFFAYTAPCVMKNWTMDLVSFIGNVVGAIAVQIVCNKKPVEKHEMLEVIHTLLK